MQILLRVNSLQPWLLLPTFNNMMEIMYRRLLRCNRRAKDAINQLRILMARRLLDLHYVVEDLHHAVALVVVVLLGLWLGGPGGVFLL
jgi:hypothetical protein